MIFTFRQRGALNNEIEISKQMNNLPIDIENRTLIQTRLKCIGFPFSCSYFAETVFHVALHSNVWHASYCELAETKYNEVVYVN